LPIRLNFPVKTETYWLVLQNKEPRLFDITMLCTQQPGVEVTTRIACNK